MPELLEGFGGVVAHVNDVVCDKLQHQLLEVAVRGMPLQPLHLHQQGWLSVRGLGSFALSSLELRRQRG